jgi:hypothetical protein
MLTLTGATGLVYVVSNSFQRAFNFNPRWLALLIAQVISIIGVFVVKTIAKPAYLLNRKGSKAIFRVPDQL